MTETSLPWDGDSGSGGVGDCGPYSSGEWDDSWRVLFSTEQHAVEGVLTGVNNELSVYGTSSPVTVSTGAAVVNGKFYINDTAENVSVPTPVSDTRIDRIVLRADYSAQTVRIARVAGTEGGAAPTVTQNDGVTWEIALAQVSITVGGVITVTDERNFAHYATAVNTAMLDAAAVTEAKIGTGAVTEAKLGTGAVTEAKIGTGAVTETKIGTGAVTEAKIGTDAVTTTKIDDGAVSNAKLGGTAKRMKGEIIMWSGTLSGHYPVDPDTAAANTAWHICNGDTENGVVTPNLQDQFVIAAGSTYTAGSSGGAATKDLSHTHGDGTLGTNTKGSHTHTMGFVTGQNQGGAMTVPSGLDGSCSEWSHTHWVSGTTHSDGSHSHTISGTTDSGGSATQDIMPPYYALTYLCYVGA